MHNMSTITPRIASRTVTISRVSIPSLMIIGVDVVDSWLDSGVELTTMDRVECYDKKMVMYLIVWKRRLLSGQRSLMADLTYYLQHHLAGLL